MCRNAFEFKMSRHIYREALSHATDSWSLRLYLVLLTCVTVSAGKVPVQETYIFLLLSRDDRFLLFTSA